MMRGRRLILVLTLAGYAGPGSPIALADAPRLPPPPAASAVRSDEDVELLLNQLLRQLAAGRTAAPDGDNAMATWKILLNTIIPPTPGAARAMTNFVREARRRAAEEQAAGRAMTAMDLTLFASEASDILQGERAEPPPPTPAYHSGRDAFADLRPSDTAPPAEPPPPPAASAELPPPPAEAAPSTVDATPPPGVPSQAPTASSPVPADPPATNPSGAAALPARDATMHTQPAPRPVPLQSRQDRARAAAAVSRGDAMLAMNDIAAARALYEYAANAGSARGARALAETYDPGFLRRLGVIGPKPDLALAAAWYRKAAALGDDGAEARIRTLAAEAAR